MPHRVAACQEICAILLDEYIATAQEYKAKGKLCPHKHPEYLDKLEEIMDHVEDAHGMIHIAMELAGHKAGNHRLEHPEHTHRAPQY